MFIATMYSYGRDADCVGVNGIMTCMGIFLVTRTQLYAIHIPAVGPASEGVYAFVRYVRTMEAGPDRRTARLYGVMNTDQRPDGVELLRSCAQQLGVSQWQAVKVDARLRTPTGGRLAAAIVCRRVGGQIRLEYNVHDDVVWQHGGTTTRTGFYRNGSCNEVLRTNLAAAGWTSINATNSTIEEPSGWWGYCSML